MLTPDYCLNMHDSYEFSRRMQM